MSISWSDLCSGPTEIPISSFSSIFFKGTGRQWYSDWRNFLSDLLMLIRHIVNTIFTLHFSVCGNLNYFTFHSKWGSLYYIQHMFLYFTEDVTFNCLDNKICNAILQTFNISTLRLKGFMESENSILFYLWQCQNSLVR